MKTTLKKKNRRHTHARTDRLSSLPWWPSKSLRGAMLYRRQQNDKSYHEISNTCVAGKVVCCKNLGMEFAVVWWDGVFWSTGHRISILISDVLITQKCCFVAGLTTMKIHRKYLHQKQSLSKVLYNPQAPNESPKGGQGSAQVNYQYAAPCQMDSWDQ